MYVRVDIVHHHQGWKYFTRYFSNLEILLVFHETFSVFQETFLVFFEIFLVFYETFLALYEILLVFCETFLACYKTL